MNAVFVFAGSSRSEYDVFSIMITNTWSRRETLAGLDAPADIPRPTPNNTAEHAIAPAARTPPRDPSVHALPQRLINPRTTASSVLSQTPGPSATSLLGLTL